MEIVKLLINQIIVMFIYMIFGFVLYKGKKISKEGSGNMATLLVWLIIPVVVVKSFCVEPTRERMIGLGLSVVAALAIQGLSILVSHLLFKKRPIDNFASAFSNAGFIGIPLVTATVGSDAVFYIAFFVALLNILQWVYGVAVITEKKMAMNKSTLLHPLILGLVLGLVLFFTGWGAKLPATVTTTLSGISALNAPLAMLIMGVYLAQADLKSLWTDKHLYILSLCRLVLIPLLSLCVLWALQLAIPAMETRMILALLISAIAPVGANVAVYAQLHNKDYVYASKTVVISTLLSLVSMPLIVLLAQYILK